MSQSENTAARARILVVEDSSVFREMQQLLLGQAGYEVSAHADPQSALDLSAHEHFDLVIIDYELPQMNGQMFMRALRGIQPDVAVIFVSGALSLEIAIQLGNEGVAGIFNKPANPKQLLEKVNETLARNAARDTAARIGFNTPLGGRPGGTPAPLPLPPTEPAADQLAFVPRALPGSTTALREFTHRLWKVRDFRSVLLLLGEPGSPFEPLAQDLAGISIFREGPFMICPPGEFEPRRLIEVLAPSLLSHDAGTLYVAGVDDFSTEQQDLLHSLISGRDIFLPFARRFRLVLTATSRLSARVDDGTFDETLYYKISSLTVAVPCLRDFRGDIATIARNLLAQQTGAAAGLDFTPDAAEWLEAQDWPGNYEQLWQTVVRAIPRAENNTLALAALIAETASADEVPANAPSSARTLGTAPVPVSAPSGPGPMPPVATVPLPPPAAPVPAPPAPSRPREKHTTPGATAVARAPASQLFGRPAAPAVRPAAAPSRFRPASASYQFAKRLEECLAAAETNSAN